MGIIFCGLVGFCLAFSFFSSFVPWWDPLGALSMNIYAFNHQKKKGEEKSANRILLYCISKNLVAVSSIRLILLSWYGHFNRRCLRRHRWLPFCIFFGNLGRREIKGHLKLGKI